MTKVWESHLSPFSSTFQLWGRSRVEFCPVTWRVHGLSEMGLSRARVGEKGGD